MPAARVKRKHSAPTGTKGAKKLAPSPSPEPAPMDSIYDDPMIDARDSSASGDEDHDDGMEESGGSEEVVEDFDDLEATNEQPRAGPSRPSSGKHLYAAPTLEELDALQSASSAGGTSFSLQLDALLGSTLLSPTPSVHLKTILSTLHSHILSLPSLPPLPPRKAVARLSEQIKWVGPSEFSPMRDSDEVKWGLGWEKPEEIIVGGSWGVVGGYKKGKGVAGSVDLVVIMPPSLFSPKDRMSYRYFHKRSHYLAVIMESLRSAASKSDVNVNFADFDLEYGYTGGDSRRSCIVMTAGKAQGLKLKTEIRIHLGVSPSTFPISTLQPSKCLLRLPSTSFETATPLYSTSIIRDTLHKSHILHLHRLSTSLSVSRAVDQFLALWRIWAGRRDISRERGGSGWFASMILGWVVDGGEQAVKGDRGKVKRVKGLGKGLGSWQALRAAWEFLANTDFTASPVFLSASGDEAISKSELTNAFTEDLLVDPTGTMNVFADWTKGEVELLRYHAKATLSMLEDSGTDRFVDVFLKDLPSGLQTFDEYLTVDISSVKVSADLPAQAEMPDRQQFLSHRIEDQLRQGLTDRIRSVVVRPLSETSLSVGLIYNPSQATRVLDIGPASGQVAESAKFEAIWGEKAELRRFKDGTISYSVVWQISRPEEAALIPSKIVSYLLASHFKLHQDAITTLSSDPDWSTIIQISSSAREAICIAGSEKQGFRPMMDAYDDLYKLLKSVDDELPLAILSVQPASELLRYSSTFVPHPIDLNRWSTSPDCLKYLPYADIILQYESSPRWPDDLAAIQKVKLAMFEKLARIVMSHKKGTKAGVVFDAMRSEIEDSASLEIITPGGIAFRVRIYHEREKTLLERVIEGEQQTFGTALPQPPKRLAAPALELHLRQFVYLPQHHSAMAPLHHRFPSYSSATRLLKRWIAAHMLGLVVSSEVIELVMAKVYLDPGSLDVPSSAVSGFIRAIELLSSWDWKAEPLYVPIFTLKQTDGARVRFPAEMREEAGRLFSEKAKKDAEGKHAGWRVITEEDLEGSRWTTGVNALVAGRVRALAKATLATVTASEQAIDVKALFATPTSDYDVLLYIHPSLVTRYPQNVIAAPEEWQTKLKYRNVQQQSVYGEEVRVGFEPALTLARDIQRLYGDSLLVFYDVHGGTAIGLLWNPANAVPRALKPFLGYNTTPAKSSAALVNLNKEAVIAEIARLGQGLIARIHKRVT